MMALYPRTPLIFHSSSRADQISKMLEADPSKRITPKDALRHPWIVTHRKRRRRRHDGGDRGGAKKEEIGLEAFLCS